MVAQIAALMWLAPVKTHPAAHELAGPLSVKNVIVATASTALIYSAGLARDLLAGHYKSPDVSRNPFRLAAGPCRCRLAYLGCRTCWAPVLFEEGSGAAAAYAHWPEGISGPWAVSGLHGMSTQALVLQQREWICRLLTFIGHAAAPPLHRGWTAQDCQPISMRVNT